MQTSRGENLSKFKFSKPTKIEFQFTPQQNADIKDNLERFGDTPTGIGRIIVKMGMVSKILRQPRIIS